MRPWIKSIVFLASLAIGAYALALSFNWAVHTYPTATLWCFIVAGIVCIVGVVRNTVYSNE